MNNNKDNSNALPIAYNFDHYEIQEVLGEGIFGITYLAKDMKLNTLVAIKEYLPKDIAVRLANNETVHPIYPQNAENFAWGLDQFLKEAQILAQFNHPNIVHVLNSFQAHDTAYIVMEYQPGQNLTHFIKEGDIATEEEIMRFIPALLDGLEIIHQANYLHCDIKPANVYVLKENYTPVITDFGWARYDLGHLCLSPIVSPGYTPFEQYQNEDNQLGPWTDIYSTAALLYRLISGKKPPEATERVSAIMQKEFDPLKPAIKVGQGDYSLRLLEAIDWGLAIKPQDRPQNIKVWRDKLFAKSKSKIENIEDIENTPIIQKPLKPAPAPQWPFAIILILITFMTIGAWLFSQEHKARLQAEFEAEKARRNYKILLAKQEGLPFTEPETTKIKPKPANKPEIITPTKIIVNTPENYKPIKPIKKTNSEAESLRIAAKQRAAATEAQLPNEEKLRIMTGAGVRLRTQPRENAKGHIILQIGTIVLEIEKTRNWYKVETPNKDIGWVNAKYMLPLKLEERAQTYIKLAKKKLNNASFGDLVDLCNFLSSASETVKLENAVELKLLYLLALQSSLRYIPSHQPKETRYSEWLKQHLTEILYKKSIAAWFVRKEAFQELYDKYRFLPIAKRILQEMPD
jgi:serine/threonine protein kinase